MQGSSQDLQETTEEPVLGNRCYGVEVVLELDVSVRGYDFLYLGATGPDKSGHWV